MISGDSYDKYAALPKKRFISGLPHKVLVARKRVRERERESWAVEPAPH